MRISVLVACGPDLGGRRSWRRCWQTLLMVRLVAFLLILGLGIAPPAQAAADIQRWSQGDTSGDRWLVSLFEQPDPDFEAGWRLRLNGLGPDQHPDHGRSVAIEDTMGNHWELPNRSQEMVPAGETAIPDGSAQFDLAELMPRPSSALPLRLLVPMQGGADRELVLIPDMIAAISTLPRAPAEAADHPVS